MSALQTELQVPKDSAAVGSFIDKLEAPLQAAVRELRAVILGAHHRVGERIKWNHPAFYYTGPMEPFDAKTYAREIAVFNLFRGRLMLVFTHGAGLNDPGAVLEGTFRDGRRTVTFTDLADIRGKAGDLQTIIQDWVARRERV
jgi:hypothetical protein